MPKIPQSPADFEPMVAAFMKKADIQVARVFDGTDGETISDDLLREHLAPLLKKAERCVRPYFYVVVAEVNRKEYPPFVMLELVPDTVKAKALVDVANKHMMKAIIEGDKTAKTVGPTLRVKFPFHPAESEVKEEDPVKDPAS